MVHYLGWIIAVDFKSAQVVPQCPLKLQVRLPSHWSPAHLIPKRDQQRNLSPPPPPIIPPDPSANSTIWFIAMKCIRKGIGGRNCQQWILPQPEDTNCRVVNLLSGVITVPRNATGCWVAMAVVHSNCFSCLNKPQVPRDCINKSQMRTGTSFKVLVCIHTQLLLGLSFYFSANIYFSLPSI